ncbi:MAG: hypothetical protein JWM71_1011, partial [Solirubrobacteraceae bacterium]|nr:hypothetical protein [Solirubrobacteraceae bacterium]
MFNHGRHGAFVIAAATALALLVPASAFASHDLSIYKNEAQVDLGSDEQTMSVSCMAGDHAIDGMWRVDHADQDDYVKPLDLIAGAVDVLRAAPTSDRTYSFTFEKNAIGRVQVKIFVTCLGDKTVGGDHVHSFATAFTKHGNSVETPTSAFDTTSVTATGTGDPANPVYTPVTTGGATNKTCPANTLLVSPGFTVDPATGIKDDSVVPQPTDPLSGMMRLYQSEGSNTGRDWTWGFENSALPPNYTAAITTTWRCLK